MKSYQLHLIRHGLTQGNLDGLYVGSGTDLPLCEQGRADLLDLRARFAYPQPDTVFCSPMRRAVETAEILFPEAGKKMVVQDHCSEKEYDNVSKKVPIARERKRVKLHFLM